MRKKVSCGITFIYNNKILLVHPSTYAWYNTLGIPKGGMEDGEDYIDTAIRELNEEVSIKLQRKDFEGLELNKVLYRNKKGKIRKKVYFYIKHINNLSEIGLDDEILPKNMLQLEEVDWAGFMTYDKAKKHIFWRYEHILDLIKK